MATPDSFFNIKPDFKPGAFRADDDRDSSYKPVNKPNSAPQSNTDFQQLLDDNDKKTGQPTTITKESKIAPPLGKEKPIGPSEEPRVEPYIEQMPEINVKIAPSIFDLSKGKSDDKLFQGELMQGTLPAGIEEEVIPLTNKLLLPKQKMTTEPLIQSPNDPPVAEHIEMTQQSKELLGQHIEETALSNQAVLSKLGSYFKPLVSKFFGENPEIKAKTFGDAGLEPTDAALSQASLLSQQNVVPIAPADQMDVDIQTATPTISTADIDALASQIIDSITISTTSDKTDTTITLKYPPLLDGSVLTVTSFKTAPHEINVTFQNLTQEGKMLLDNIANRNALDSALDQKGITMHMITTTTYIENTNFSDSSSLARDKKEGRGGQQPGFGGQDRQQGNKNQS